MILSDSDVDDGIVGGAVPEIGEAEDNDPRRSRVSHTHRAEDSDTSTSSARLTNPARRSRLHFRLHADSLGDPSRQQVKSSAFKPLAERAAAYAKEQQRNDTEADRTSPHENTPDAAVTRSDKGKGKAASVVTGTETDHSDPIDGKDISSRHGIAVKNVDEPEQDALQGQLQQDTLAKRKDRGREMNNEGVPQDLF